MRRAGRRPEPLGAGLHLKEESAEIPPGDRCPVFFSCLGKGLGCQTLIQNRSAFRSILWRSWGSCSHPRKIQREKKVMEASRSLFNSVWGLSEPWVSVSIKNLIKHRLGIISVGCLPVTGPQELLRGSFSARGDNGRWGQTIRRSLSLLVVLSLALNKTGVPPFCLLLSTIFRASGTFQLSFTIFQQVHKGTKCSI